MSNVKDYYIQGEHYDWITDPRLFEKVFHNKREKDTVKVINKYARNSKILDVGCGTGLISRNLKGDIICYDINEWCLEKARTHVPNAKFILGDCEDMKEIVSTSVDTVVCTETLEHLPNPEKAVSEIKRVLKVGGRAIVTVPSKSLIWKFRMILTSTHPHSEPFHKNYSIKELRELFRDFTVLKVSKVAFGLTLIGVVEKK